MTTPLWIRLLRRMLLQDSARRQPECREERLLQPADRPVRGRLELPGTTSRSREDGQVGGQTVAVVDTRARTPQPNSEDERVARDVVLEPGDKTVVQVADAKNCGGRCSSPRNSPELGLPMVLVLNMWTRRRTGASR